jgi:excisionase family DNA binding protein
VPTKAPHRPTVMPHAPAAPTAPTTRPHLTVAEVAELLGVGEATVLGWVRSGELVAVNVSRSARSKKPRWRITRAALDAFTQARTAAPVPVKAPRRTRAAADVIEFYK